MEVMKIYPKIEELTAVSKKVLCPEEGCGKFFTSGSNLTLHLVKSHSKQDLWSSSVKQYHCPNVDCIYSKSKCFKQFKLLKQHYLKVHLEKKYECSECRKKFSTEVLLQVHTEYCGVLFRCFDCNAQYNCYDTLNTHCRRKKHKILEKANYKLLKDTNKEKLPEGLTPHTHKINKIIINAKYILPKPARSTNENKTSQGSQTEKCKPTLQSKFTQVQNYITLNQNTQTGSSSSQFTVETQTNLKHGLEEDMEFQNRKSIKTQTNSVASKTSACNTSFNLNDFDFTFKTDIETNSSGTQTHSSDNLNIYSSSTTTHDSIYTDTSDLHCTDEYNSNLGPLDSNFFNCNTETQTDYILENDLFNYNYYDFCNNMHTQTCEDILSESLFNDGETQTVFEEFLRSVESQTMMSHNTRNATLNDLKYKTNMETQTETEFNKKLEEIHS